MITQDHSTISNEAYHADHANVSASMLKVYRTEGPAMYNARFVAHTIPSPEATPAQLQGTATHCLTLEPDQFASRFTVAPKVDRRTTAGKAAWAEFCAASGGKTILDADTHANALAMADAIRHDPIARILLSEDGVCEKAMYWDDPDSGMPCKLRADKLIEDAVQPIVVDVKTCLNPLPNDFERSAWGYGYGHQAAHYCSGVREAYDVQAVLCYIIAVRNVAPWDVFVYEMDDAELLQQCHAANVAGLKAIRLCMVEDDWRHEAQKHATKLRAPRYARPAADTMAQSIIQPFEEISQ